MGLPTWLIDKLEAAPPSGGDDRYPGGVHSDWMPSVTNALAHYVEPSVAVEVIRTYISRDATPGEIERTVEKIYASKDYTPSSPYPPPSRISLLPPHDPAELLRVWETVTKGKGSTDLKSVLREVLTGVPRPGTNEILATLYRPDDLICIGGANLSRNGKEKLDGYWAETRTRRELTEDDLSIVSLIVPNPMRKSYGTTLGPVGHLSARCRDNAAENRRYLVMDFDLTGEGSFGAALAKTASRLGSSIREAGHSLALAAVFYLLATEISTPHARLILIVDSGGKSVHAWFDAAALSFAEAEAFFRRGVPFGADPALFFRTEQFARMPGGTREISGARQEILFFDPNREPLL